MAYNVATGLAFLCPVTNQIKGGAFEVPIPMGAAAGAPAGVPAGAPAVTKVTGVVLSDHLRSVDWIARNADFHSQAPTDLVLEVLARIEAILAIES
jgi:mRNA interferase MazF